LTHFSSSAARLLRIDAQDRRHAPWDMGGSRGSGNADHVWAEIHGQELLEGTAYQGSMAAASNRSDALSERIEMLRIPSWCFRPTSNRNHQTYPVYWSSASRLHRTRLWRIWNGLHERHL